MRRPAFGAAALLLLAASCAAPPEVEEVEGPAAVDAAYDRCVQQFRAGAWEPTAATAEALLAAAPDDARAETILFMAAEARYRTAELERALILFKRLHGAFPYGRAVAVLPERLWTIGAAWLDAPPTYASGLVVDRAVGIDALSYLVVHFERHPWTDDAWLRLGAAHTEEGQYDLAAEAYERLLARYPTSELAEEALWRSALARRQGTKDGACDTESLLAAYDAAGRYLERYGEAAVHAVEARELRTRLEAEVVAAEVAVADFYARRGSTAGERLHLAHAALRFPDAEGADEARRRLDALGGPPDVLALDRLEGP
jgi:outer membrane protein assembly factor BamD (BamD/ComL family)